MEDIRFSGNLHLKITTSGFVSVVRNENFTFPYPKGKGFFSIVFASRGALEYHFIKDKKTYAFLKCLSENKLSSKESANFFISIYVL